MTMDGSMSNTYQGNDQVCCYCFWARKLYDLHCFLVVNPFLIQPLYQLFVHLKLYQNVANGYLSQYNPKLIITYL